MPFTSQTASAAGSKRGPNRKATPEIALGIALRYLVSVMRNSKAAPHLRIAASRAVLSTLHDAGVKPSQRDLAVVFRGLARAERETPVAVADNVADASAAPVGDEKSK